MHFKQRSQRHARLLDDMHVAGGYLDHPGRNRHGRAIGPPHNVAGLVVNVMQPDNREAFTDQRVKAVADYDLTREMLTGRMPPRSSEH
jgi:hypothetical protein